MPPQGRGPLRHHLPPGPSPRPQDEARAPAAVSLPSLGSGSSPRPPGTQARRASSRPLSRAPRRQRLSLPARSDTHGGVPRPSLGRGQRPLPDRPPRTLPESRMAARVWRPAGTLAAFPPPAPASSSRAVRPQRALSGVTPDRRAPRNGRSTAWSLVSSGLPTTRRTAATREQEAPPGRTRRTPRATPCSERPAQPAVSGHQWKVLAPVIPEFMDCA
jgi:hypothetical protein